MDQKAIHFNPCSLSNFFLGKDLDDSKNMPDKGQKRLALILLKTVGHPRKKLPFATR
jgi:hypothetical protein